MAVTRWLCVWAGVSVFEPFELRLRKSRRPGAPLDVALLERTQWDFTITWNPPPRTAGIEVVLYSLEMSTTGAATGTYKEYEEIWQGPGQHSLHRRISPSITLACLRVWSVIFWQPFKAYI